MFRPRDSHDLRLLRTGLTIEPAAAVRWIHDPFGNSIAIATFTGSTEALELNSTICLEHFAQPLELPPIEEYARTLPFSYLAEEAPDLARYVERHYPDPNAMVSSWTKQFMEGEGGPETFATLTRMCKGIQESLNYAMRFEPGTQPPAVTLEAGTGTCRDYALLMMEGVRAPRPRGTVRHRLPLRSRPRRRRRRPGLSACLDRGLSAGRWLGGIRPDQWHHRHRAADPRRRRPRSGPGDADQGQPSRERPTSP